MEESSSILFPSGPPRCPSTTEVYAGVTFDNIMLAPSGTFYIDVNETGQDGGRTGFYFLLAAGHSFATNSDVSRPSTSPLRYPWPIAVSVSTTMARPKRAFTIST